MMTSSASSAASFASLDKEAKRKRLAEIEREKQRREQAERFETYAPTNLFVRTENQGIQPFRLNRVQLYIHQKLEEQLAKTGRVRALILKGRKQGCSTYVAGRFYWKTTHTEGVQTTIMAHEQVASSTLFGIVDLFYQRDPYPQPTKAANAKELDFAALVSGYSVLTAGTKGTGRSQTPQYLHASEFGFWPNAAGHMAGIFQAVPEADGTEIIVESTSKGPGDAFHTMWRQAEAGESDYIPLFIPWFWTAHYRREVPKGFELTEEELEYKTLHGLEDSQMAWRRAKIASVPDGEHVFRQEYPATAAEAFQAADDGSYIPAKSILKARKTDHVGIGPLIIGADPARYGNDRFSLAWRRGRRLMKVESRRKLGIVEGASWIKGVIDREKPARVFIDLGGLGAGVYDILHAWGDPYKSVVVGVNFGSPPLEPFIFLENGDKRPGPKNKRAEMYMHAKKWLEQEGGASIPDSDSLQADACGARYRYDPITQHLIIESKEDMMKRGLISPDEWDATILTFAEPVADIDRSRPNVRPRASDPRVGV